VIDHGIGAAFTNSVACVELTKAYDLCKAELASRLAAIDHLEAQDGKWHEGRLPTTIICEKPAQ
jgi:hypothetical protein